MRLSREEWDAREYARMMEHAARIAAARAILSERTAALRMHPRERGEREWALIFGFRFHDHAVSVECRDRNTRSELRERWHYIGATFDQCEAAHRLSGDLDKWLGVARRWIAEHSGD